MVIDPVCEMEIDPEEAAARVEYGDEVYFFCCTSCRDRFVADPAKWLAAEEEEEEEERRTTD